MEYNTTRSKMLMPEYGRNVQKMVEFILTIDDNEKKLKLADSLIELMGTLNPHLKAIEDYKHKLWDHLYQMTDFRLDVDGPYPPPLPEEIHRKPDPLPYPQHSLANRHLGKNLSSLLQKALEETDENKKQGFTQTIGYYMKLAYTNWHKEPIHDDMIRNELAELTNGQLQYETGGYKVYFDNRPNNNFKRNNNGNGSNPNNRNFKNAGPRSNNNNPNPRGNGFGNNPNSANSTNSNSANSNSGGYNNFNKNRKYNKNNKNKNIQ